MDDAAGTGAWTPADELVVDDPGTARAIASTTVGSMLGPFLQRSCTVAEAARQTGEPIGRVHYAVSRLTRLGLLRVARVEARAGRPIRHYRAVARRFRVPAAVLPTDHFRRVLRAEVETLAQGLLETHASFVHDGDLTIVPSGAVGVSFDRSESSVPRAQPHAITSTLSLTLTRDEAVELRGELQALRDRWLARAAEHGSGPATYLLLLGLAPQPGGTEGPGPGGARGPRCP